MESNGLVSLSRQNHRCYIFSAAIFITACTVLSVVSHSAVCDSLTKRRGAKREKRETEFLQQSEHVL